MRSQSQTSSTKESSEQPPTVVIHISFPNQFTRSNEEEEEREILKMFHKFEELNCNEKICMEENASAVMQQKLPPKCEGLKVFEVDDLDKIGVAIIKHLELRNKAARLLKNYWHEEEVIK